MAIDVFKPTGPAKMSKPEAGGGNNKNVPLIGVVKDNIDPTRAGRIKVALQSGKGGSDPNSSESWVTVQYLSTFFGAVGGTAGNNADDHGTYKTNPSSYGQWQAPPDIGTKVVCIFINGDPNFGFYIGCIPEPEKLQMVPAIGASDTVTLNPNEANSYGGATRLPVTNMNTNNKDKADSSQFLETARPVHSYSASIMSQQGIIRDPVRGPISSSASREPASRVGWGISTPGRPIYSGGYDDSNLPNNLESSKAQQLQVIARRGGHSIVMDDGDIIGRDQLIRIRTALGHQILMSDDGQTLMILHSNGQSYIELGKEGTVDIYSTNSFNVRTHGDINFHADRDINFHAAENLNFQAKNIHTNSEETIKFRAGSAFQMHTLSTFSVKAKSVAMSKGGMLSSLTSGITKAFKLTLPPVNALSVLTTALSAITSAPPSVPKITLVKQTDTLHDKEKGWAAAPEKLVSITSRAPAHAPWANAGLGVSIKTSADALSSLPASPSSAVQQTVQAGKASGIAPPALATIMSSPTVNAVSKSVNSSATNALIGATATAASKGIVSKAVSQGAAIVGAASNIANIASGKNNITVAAGAFGQTVSQLETAGVLKPGADKLITGLVSSGTKLVDAVSNTLFTGKPGAETLYDFVTNIDTQAATVVDTLQTAQTALTNLGVISGKEDSSQTAGIVVAAATTGVTNTVNTIKAASALVNSKTSQFNEVLNAVDAVSALSGSSITNEISPVINQFQGAVSNVSHVLGSASNVLNAIGAGNAAAGLTSALGGLSGISKTVNSLFGKGLSSLTGSDNGASAEAFYAIINSFPKLQPNVPQVLSKIAKDAAGMTAEIADTTPSQLPGRVLSSLVNTITDMTNTENILSSESVDELQPVLFGDHTIENTIAGITGTVTTSTQGINDLSSVINSLSGTKISLPSQLSTITSTVSHTATDVMGLINTVSGKNNSNTSGVINTINQISSLAGAAQALASGGLSGLAKAAKSTQVGASAAQASALASGIYYLPGGIKSFSSIVDNAVSLDIIPGARELTGLIGNAQTLVQNGLGGAIKTLGTVNNITTQLTGLNSKISGVLNISPISGLGKITGISNLTSLPLGNASKALGGITSVLSSKLSLGSASTLFSALGSLFGGGDDGPAPTKLPEIGFNTFARETLTTQIVANLNDPGIPEPNLLGEIKPETVDALNSKIDELKKIRADLKIKKDEYKARRDAAKKAYKEAEGRLPAGDPGILTAKQAWEDAVGEYNYYDLAYDIAGDNVSTAELQKSNPVLAAQVKAQTQAIINNTTNG